MQRGSVKNNHDRTRLYRMVEFIGRWSMLDVFVDTFTVALVQLSPLMSVAPGTGVLFFAAVVVLTMLAAETFDPRLIWDSANPHRIAMADEPDLDTLPQAVVVRKRRMRFSIVWIIPILAGLVAIGIAVQRVISQGPTITIDFKSASGIEAGKTFIKYKDVRIGLVSAVELSEDYSKVLVKAKIAKHSAGLMVEDAKFWVVEPRISLSGVSGLNTLLSGNYIGFQAGKSTEDQRTLRRARRAADDHGPAAAGASCSRRRTLGSLGVGDPGLLPGPAGRPGGGHNLAAGRPVGRHHGLHRRALRQICHAARRASGTRAASTSRSAPTASMCAPSRWRRCWPAASRSTRRTSCTRAAPAAENIDVPDLSQSADRDEAARPGRAALRAVFQRIGARAVGRRAGDAVRTSRRRSHRLSACTSSPRRKSSVRAC